MDEELISDAAVAGEVILVEERTPPRQQSAQRGTKRQAATTPASARKQQLVSTTATPLTYRGTAAATVATAATSRGSEAADNVTYRLVQISGSSESAHRHQNLVQQATAHIITTNGQGEYAANSGHQIVLNPSSGLTFSTAAVQEASPTRVAYVPASAISVAASPAAISQPIQLQSFDGSGGSYYIMLPTGSEILQTTPATQVVATAATTPTRVIAAPRLQQAAFIPLSRLEPVQTATLSNVQPTSSATAHVVKQLEFHVGDQVAGGSKEIKRRVSHNEVEKRRRDKINNWITRLARVVPNAANECSSTKVPQSKGGVLAKTVDYIQELRESNEQLVDTVRHYDSVINCLKEESTQLRSLLQQAGIEAPPPLAYDFTASADLLIAVNSARSASSPHATTTASVPVTTSAATSSASSNATTVSSAAVSTSSASASHPASGTPIVGMVKGRQYLLVPTNKRVGFVQKASQGIGRDQNEQEESAESQDDEDHSGHE